MPSLRILLLCIAAAAGYGVILEQIAARVCLEYFTIHLFRINSTSPTILGLYWGWVASWWVGAGLGVPLVLICRAGARPKLRETDLWRPIASLLLAMAVCAALAGVVGYALPPDDTAILLISPERVHGFNADLRANHASYAMGILGGIAVMIWAWRERTRRFQKEHPRQDGQPDISAEV